MRTVTLPREFTVLMFDRPGTVNPSSSLQVVQIGDRAFIHSLIGPGFYAMLAEEGLAAFAKKGVRYVYAAVSDAHLRLMRTRLPGIWLEELAGGCEIEGHRFNWVLLQEGPAPSQ
ncbi:hypothetical protein [Rhodoferax sp. WC2427]|uniref:hypothetical protein n=1 Tax=Rhodoferax sp. WC2427 TaxID=3234144 RepID=UPI0034674144